MIEVVKVTEANGLGALKRSTKMKFLSFALGVTLLAAGCRNTTSEKKTEIEVVEFSIEWVFDGIKPDYKVKGKLQNTGNADFDGQVRIRVKIDKTKSKPSYFLSVLNGKVLSDDELLDTITRGRKDVATPNQDLIEAIIKDDLLEERPSMTLDVELEVGEERYYEMSKYLEVNLKPGEVASFIENVNIPTFAAFRSSTATVEPVEQDLVH